MKALIMLFLLIVAILIMNCGKSPIQPSKSIANHSPKIVQLISSSMDVAVGGKCTITCRAEDEIKDKLVFEWFASTGIIQGADSTAIWYSNTTCEAEIGVYAIDEMGAKDSSSISIRCHRNDPKKILVDASHDGGVWWFPQVAPFDPQQHHQGKALADFIRFRGFQVDEFPRGISISDSLLNCYDKVIMVSNYSSCFESEIEAYLNFVNRATSLMLISEYLRVNAKDELAETLGIEFKGIAKGYVSRYAAHQITDGAQPFYYNAGSVVFNANENANMEILGWLSETTYVDLNGNDIRDSNEPYGMPVMGILHNYISKIFFIGDINGIESMPQPLIRCLIQWLFE